MGGKRRMGHRRALVIAAVALLAVGLVWGLGSAVAGSESPSPAAGKITLRLGWTNDPDNLNPFIGYESSSYEIWAINYELLVGFRASDMANVPGVGLATAWETSPDGKVWTFTITDKSKWQDGEPLTAADVAFTYNYVIKNKMGMFIDYMKFIDKVEAPDATTVVFTCSKPKANMLGLWIPILPEHIWSKIKPADAEKSFKNPPPIIGSGPFQTVEVKKGGYVRMVANKDYWRGAPKVDEVIFQTYQNQDTMAQDLKTGAIQTRLEHPVGAVRAARTPSPISRRSARSPSASTSSASTAPTRRSIPKSTGHPVLQDPAFRSALQWAVDKDKIVSIGYNGNAAPADTIITRDYYSPEADYHWTPPVGDPGTYTFDLEKAKAALDAAGYTDGDGNGIREYKGKDIKLRLYARSESPQSQNCGKLITGWFEEVGLDIDYQVIDDGALGDKQYNYEGDQYAPDFDLFIWGWGGDVDPNFILSVLTTDSIEAWSDCIWSNAEYDKLFLEQQTTIDVAEAHRDSSTRCSRSSTRSRRTSRWSTPSTSRWPTPPTGPGGCAPTRTRAPGGTTPSRTRTWPCSRAPRSSTTKSSSTGLIAAIVIAAIVVVLVIVLLVRRRGGRSEVEA